VDVTNLIFRSLSLFIGTLMAPESNRFVFHNQMKHSISIQFRDKKALERNYLKIKRILGFISKADFTIGS